MARATATSSSAKRSDASSLPASERMVTSSGDPASVQMAAYLAAEAVDLFGRMNRLSRKLQMRGFMGQIRGSVRNSAR